MSAVAILSRKSAAIDYRPHAHHKLHTDDRHFDCRFNAYLRCQDHLHSVYHKAIDSNRKFVELVGHLRGKERSSGSSKHLYSTLVTTGLSDADRASLVDRLVAKIENDSSYAVIAPTPPLYASSNDLLVEVVESILLKFSRLAGDEKRRSSARTAEGFSDDEVLKLKEVMPIKALSVFFEESRIADVDIKVDTIILCIRHCENMDPDTFDFIFSQLHYVLPFDLHLVFFQSAHCDIRFHSLAPSQLFTQMSIMSSVTPFEIYDEVMTRALADLEIPVLFPAEAIAWIHESFWRSSGCVKSAVDRMLMCLGIHFARRCSILCMFEDTQWLRDMQVLSSAVSSFGVNKRRTSSGAHTTSSTATDNPYLDDAAAERNVAALLLFIGERDLDGTRLTFQYSISPSVPAAAARTPHNSRSSATGSVERGEAAVQVTAGVGESGGDGRKQGVGISKKRLSGIIRSPGDYGIWTKLRRSRVKAKIDHCFFHCILMVRNLVLGRRRAEEYSSDIIYAAIIAADESNRCVTNGGSARSASKDYNSSNNKNGDRSSLLEAFVDTVAIQLKAVPFSTLNRLVVKIIEKISQLVIALDDSMESEKNDLLVLCRKLDEVFCVCDTLFELLTSLSIPDKVTLNQLKAADKAASTSADVATSKSCDNVIQTNIETKNEDDEENHFEGKGSSGSIITSTSDDADDNDVNEHVGAEDGNEENVIPSLPDGFGVVDLALNILEDFMTTFRFCVNTFSKMPARGFQPLPGVLDVSFAAAKTAAVAIDGNYRFTFSDGLCNPRKAVKTSDFYPCRRLADLRDEMAGKDSISPRNLKSAISQEDNIPDVCIIAQEIISCGASVSIGDIYEVFKSRIAPLGSLAGHKKVAVTNPGKGDPVSKRASNCEGGGDKPSKKSKSDPSSTLPSIPSSAVTLSTTAAKDDLETRCRFTTSLNDVVTCGLAKVRSGGRYLARSVYSWVAGKAD